jgi:hypothetical protein
MDHHPDPEQPAPPAGDPQKVGRWETIPAEFTNAATHVALLHTNKIFAHGGSSLDRNEFANPTLPPGEILDLSTTPYQVRPITRDGLAGDLWCGGHTLLKDGTLLMAGGTGYYPPTPDPFYGGLKQAYLFDPEAETWERLPDMQEGRWYPTLIRLPDNRVLCVAGLKYRPPDSPVEKSALRGILKLIFTLKDRIVTVQEIFDPETKSWQTLGPEWFAPLYPRLHLLPDGDVFFTGAFNAHYFLHGKFPSAQWDAGAHTWTERGGRHFKKNREEGLSILLALRPEQDYRVEVMIAGGGTHTLGTMLVSVLHGIGRGVSNFVMRLLTDVEDSVERIDLSAPAPKWHAVGKMLRPRVHAAGVLLPDGKVLVVGGMSEYGMGEMHQPAHPVLEAELYDPETDQWTLMAAQERARVYHSSALLLPDGRVISMGSNPRAGHIERKIEIFSPPYVFADRPAILAAPGEIRIGGKFTVEVDDAQAIGQVVLMRPEVYTHVTNTDQRLLELEFAPLDATHLEAEGPPSAGHMPEGHSLLFVLNKANVPSEGRFVLNQV